MVLPERIELSTSPLPRECSTTELRQRFGQSGLALSRNVGAFCHRGQGMASAPKGRALLLEGLSLLP